MVLKKKTKNVPEDRLVQYVGGDVAGVHVSYFGAWPDLLQPADVLARNVCVVFRAYSYLTTWMNYAMGLFRVGLSLTLNNDSVLKIYHCLRLA